MDTDTQSSTLGDTQPNNHKNNPRMFKLFTIDTRGIKSYFEHQIFMAEEVGPLIKSSIFDKFDGLIGFEQVR